MTARKNRGMGNNHSKAWDNSPLWDSIKKPEGDCKHLRLTFTPDGKFCKDCEKIIKGNL